MNPELLAAAALGTFALAATYTDLRERMIPDWLNYGAVIVAAGFAYYTNQLTVTYFALVALAFLFAYALYRLGAWAGGDVKFYTGLLAFYPLFAPLPTEPLALLAPLALVFLASAILLVPVMLALHLPQIWGERAALARALAGAGKRAVRGAPLAAAVGVLVVKAGSPLLALIIAAVLLFVTPPIWLALLALGGAVAWDYTLALPALGFALLALAFISFAQSSFGILAKKVLRRPVPMEQVQEGVIPAHTLYLDEQGNVQTWEPPAFSEGVRRVLQTGRIEVMLPPQGKVLADCLKARGLTTEEIEELRKAGVKEIVIKESTPFAPVLALGLACSILLARGLLA